METFQTTWKVFQTTLKVSGQSVNISGNLITFKTILKVFTQSRKFPDNMETFQRKYVQCKNFLDAQKLSGEECSHAPYIFLSLGVGGSRSLLKDVPD